MTHLILHGGNYQNNAITCYRRGSYPILDKYCTISFRLMLGV